MGQSCTKAGREEFQLLKAAKDGNSEAVAEVIYKNVNWAATAQTWNGQTLWHIAARYGHFELLQGLVDAVRYNPAGPQQWKKLLALARRYGHSTDAILKHCVNLQDVRSQTPLHLACTYGHAECAELLLKLGATPWCFDELGGRTPLHYAASMGHVDCIRAILAQPAPNPGTDNLRYPNTTRTRLADVANDSGYTPLHYAVWAANVASIRALVSYDSNLTPKNVAAGSDWVQSGLKCTPLHLAAFRGNTEVVKVILSAYVQGMHAVGNDGNPIRRKDPRRQINATRQLPYHVAVARGHRHLAELLHPEVPYTFVLTPADLEATARLYGPPKLSVLAAAALQRKLQSDIETGMKMHQEQALAKAAGACGPVKPDSQRTQTAAALAAAAAKAVAMLSAATPDPSLRGGNACRTGTGMIAAATTTNAGSGVISATLVSASSLRASNNALPTPAQIAAATASVGSTGASPVATLAAAAAAVASAGLPASLPALPSAAAAAAATAASSSGEGASTSSTDSIVQPTKVGTVVMLHNNDVYEHGAEGTVEHDPLPLPPAPISPFLGLPHIMQPAFSMPAAGAVAGYGEAQNAFADFARSSNDGATPAPAMVGLDAHNMPSRAMTMAAPSEGQDGLRKGQGLGGKRVPSLRSLLTGARHRRSVSQQLGSGTPARTSAPLTASAAAAAAASAADPHAHDDAFDVLHRVAPAVEMTMPDSTVHSAPPADLTLVPSGAQERVNALPKVGGSVHGAFYGGALAASAALARSSPRSVEAIPALPPSAARSTAGGGQQATASPVASPPQSSAVMAALTAQQQHMNDTLHIALSSLAEAQPEQLIRSYRILQLMHGVDLQDVFGGNNNATAATIAGTPGAHGLQPASSLRRTVSVDVTPHLAPQLTLAQGIAPATSLPGAGSSSAFTSPFAAPAVQGGEVAKDAGEGSVKAKPRVTWHGNEQLAERQAPGASVPAEGDAQATAPPTAGAATTVAGVGLGTASPQVTPPATARESIDLRPSDRPASSQALGMSAGQTSSPLLLRPSMTPAGQPPPSALGQTLRQLSSRLQSELGDSVCGVCFDQPDFLCIEKCGHRLCGDCSKELCKLHAFKPALCPFCRGPISGFKTRRA